MVPDSTSEAATCHDAKWERRYLGLAAHIAAWSSDTATKVGCVIVGPNDQLVSVGFNALPRGINETIAERHRSGPEGKQIWYEHAERNAIFIAARHGLKLEGCRLFMNWFPCADCARAIIQAGIIEVIGSRYDPTHERWGKSFAIAMEMLTESGVRVTIR